MKNAHSERPASASPAGALWRIDRRDFLKVSAGALFGLTTGCLSFNASAPQAPRIPLRFGIVTDPHYADAAPSGTRYYRESIPKMREAIAKLRGENLAFLAALGDSKDMARGEPDAKTLANLIAIEAEIQKFGGPTYHVLGNHDMDNLSKAQVLSNIVNAGIPKDQSYYAFSVKNGASGGIRFIVLDACFTADGKDYDHGRFQWQDTNIPSAELQWLERELADATDPVVILAHQRLDGAGDVYVKNAAQVRAALEKPGKVLAVFMGHDHPGGYNLINGIHYYTQIAIVEGSGPENNSYSTVEIGPDLSIAVVGYRRAVAKSMSRAANLSPAGAV